MFRPLDSPQRHEGQDKKDVQGAVESARQLEITSQPAQQPIRAQGRQAGQHTAQRDIVARFETRRGASRQSHGRLDPFVGPRARGSHPPGRVRIGSAALTLGARDDRLRRVLR